MTKRYQIKLEYDAKQKLFVPMYKKHWWNFWHPWNVNYFAIGYKTAEEAFAAITKNDPIRCKY